MDEENACHPSNLKEYLRKSSLNIEVESTKELRISNHFVCLLALRSRNSF